MMRVIGVAVFVVAALSGCTSSAGNEGEPCYPNGTCNGELTCLSFLCVQAPAATAAPAAALAEEPRQPAAQPPPPAATTALPVAAPRPAVADPAEVAAAAYRDVIAAWNELDETAYFDGYMPVVACWYDRANRRRADIQSSSRGAHFRDRTSSQLAVDRLELIEASVGQVTFIDHGRLVGSTRTLPHQKLIVMRPYEGRWRIVVEASPEQHGCWPHIPAAFAAPAAPEPTIARRGERASGRGECRVRTRTRTCEGVAGGPPCTEQEFYDRSALIPPRTRRSTMAAALSAASDDFNCNFDNFVYGENGYIRSLEARCMGGDSHWWTYENCD